MKLCFVGFDDLPVLAPEFSHHGAGGEQVQRTLLARALVRRGFDVSMVVYDYGQPDGAIWDGVRTVRVHRVDAGLPVLRFVHPRWTSLLSALRRANADVYYFSCSGPALGQGALFAQQHKRRVVFRVAHDLDCEPGAPLVHGWHNKKLYEYGLRHADAILVQGLRQQEALRRNYGLPSSIAGMLVDPPGEILAFAARSIDALWVNNMNHLKRPARFLELAFTMPSLRSHMIGGPQRGYEGLFQDVSERAAKLPSLTFHGRVPYHKVNQYYARSRVFVNTSDSEGFPNSYLQAWIRGTPVVAYFDPDGVIDREGLGAAVTTEAEMRESVTQLASSPSTWLETSGRCRRYMAERYSEESVLRPYINAFGRK